MRGRAHPQTPSEHHAEAIALLLDAEDYPVNSAVYVGFNVRAAAHASLALYSPTPEVPLAVVEPVPVKPRATRKKATPKKESIS